MESKTDVVDDLQSRLDKALEKKTPGASLNNNSDIPVNPYWQPSEDDFKKKPGAAEAAKENLKSATPGETKKEIIDDEEEEEEEPEIEEEEKKHTKGAKPSEKMKLGGARSATGTLELTIKMIAVPLINYQAKKKFNVNEINKLDRISDMPITSLEGEELTLRNKFDRIMEKRDKKIAMAKGFTPDRKEDLIDAWKEYFDFTETTMSPMYYLMLASFNAVAGTIMDIALE